MNSLAGGTGSGLGSHLMELLSDEFPSQKKLNVCVVPHLTGEVILQAYNCILTISTLYQQSEGIILIENDQIANICMKLLNL